MSESTASANNCCPKCGAVLPSTATAGLCPRCLMAEAMAPTEVEAEPAPQPPLPPEQIAPHFPQLEILECLGRGGMGVVYKARQKSLGRLVALKLLAPERAGDTKFAERFAHEAQALAALNHPNIVTIHDFGQAGGFYYLLMEYVDGANLRQLLRTRRFTPEEALAIVPALCDALQFAHNHGIVHRDIKPENLLLDTAGRVKVADFGIAKMLGTADTGGHAGPISEPDNATQTTVETPGYSAPEQKTDPQRVDSRADIYSLGVVFYEMLTGELPGKRIEPPSKKVHIDARLDAVVLRALEKTPGLRWQTAEELRTEVETLSNAANAKGAATSTSTATAAKGTLKSMTKSKTRVVTVSAAILAACFVLFEIVHVIRVAISPNIEGAWEGIAHISNDTPYFSGAGIDGGKEGTSRVVLKFFKTNGGYRATADWIDLGKRDVPLGKVVYNYPRLEIHPTVRDTWQLRLNTTEMTWDHYINFIQPDPVVFTRTTAPDTASDPLTESDFAPGGRSDLQGYWEGDIGTGTGAIPVDIKIARQTDGTYRAEGDKPMAGVAGRPITVSYNPPLVELMPTDGVGMFSGQLNASGTEISGAWTASRYGMSGGESVAGVIRRVDYQAEHAHDTDRDYSFTSESDLQGHWTGAWIAVFDGGKVKVPIRVALDIAKLPNGSYSAALASPDQFGAEAPIAPSDFEYSTPDLHMEWQPMGGTYDGRLENGKLTGTWSQGGGGFALVFERTND